MPRKSPERFQPIKKKTAPSLRPKRDHSQSMTCDCPRCGGFMFCVVVKYEGSNNLMDEMECFDCKKIHRLGLHNPHRKLKNK